MSSFAYFIHLAILMQERMHNDPKAFKKGLRWTFMNWL